MLWIPIVFCQCLKSCTEEPTAMTIKKIGKRFASIDFLKLKACINQNDGESRNEKNKTFQFKSLPIDWMFCDYKGCPSQICKPNL